MLRNFRQSRKGGKQEDWKLYGIAGHPLAHSLSPAMQESAFGACGIRAFYLVLDFQPAGFRRVLRRLGKLPLSGFNVTVPYKEAVLPYLDLVSEEARRIGAVNTVYRKGRRWLGTNTDVSGFVRSLAEEGKFRIRGSRVLVLGAGGACRAVIYGLARQGAAFIALANRRPERAARLVREFRKIFPRTHFESGPLAASFLKPQLENCSLAVNATSLGMKASDPELFPRAWIPRKKTGPKLFMDLIYSPRETRFLRGARLRGHRTLNGVGMLVGQGAKAFEIWTGCKAPVSVMRRALETALDTRERNLRKKGS